MLYQNFSLGEEYPEASLTAYICDQGYKAPPRAAVIVCPGGGYAGLSPREGEPVVRRFFAEGFNVFLLKYSVGAKAGNYAPLIEAARAIKLVRQRANEDNTDPNKIFILGFSAGGHLAASSGTLWNIPVVRDAVGVSSGEFEEGINRPDGMVLCYPVITLGKYSHGGTALRVNGRDPSEGFESLTPEEIKRFSLDLHVDSTTPPAFIWHTFADKTVSVQNSLIFMNALTEANIPFEAHIFPDGVHGMALCNEESSAGNANFIQPCAAAWPELAVKWIKSR